MTSGRLQTDSKNFARLFERVATELRSNRRALIGTVTVAALLALYLVSTVQDYINDLQNIYLERTVALQRTEKIGGERDWLDRSQKSEASRQFYEARLWTAESEGVAVANLSDWVTDAGHKAGLSKLQVKIEVSQPKDLPSNFRRLVATITCEETEDALYSFLQQVDASPHLLFFDRLQVQQTPCSAHPGKSSRDTRKSLSLRRPKSD